LGRQDLVGIEIAACGEGNALIGLEGRGTIFMVNEINELAVEKGPVPSATCPRESVLPIRLRPDFSVVFEGYAGGAEHWPVAKRPGSGLSGPIFSGPHDCADLVNFS
jgi:hypothetical protein